MGVRSLKLTDICLKSLSHSLLPQGKCADELASKKAAQLSKGVAKPFIFVDLKDFAPFRCATTTTGSDEPKHLKFAQWYPAFDRRASMYSRALRLFLASSVCRAALALAADGQWQYVSAMARKDIFLQVRISGGVVRQRLLAALCGDR